MMSAIYFFSIIAFIAYTLAAFHLMGEASEKVPNGQVSNNTLTKKEKWLVFLLSFFDPLLAGAIFYYGWRKKLPVKAKIANRISILALVLLLIIGYFLNKIGIVIY